MKPEGSGVLAPGIMAYRFSGEKKVPEGLLAINRMGSKKNPDP